MGSPNEDAPSPRQLEQLQPNAAIRGILPDTLVTAVSDQVTVKVLEQDGELYGQSQTEGYVKMGANRRRRASWAVAPNFDGTLRRAHPVLDSREEDGQLWIVA